MGKKRILAGVLAIAMTATMALSGCGDSSAATDAGDGQKADYSNEEYVWVSCHTAPYRSTISSLCAAFLISILSRSPSVA